MAGRAPYEDRQKFTRARYGRAALCPSRIVQLKAQLLHAQTKKLPARLGEPTCAVHRNAQAIVFRRKFPRLLFQRGHGRLRPRFEI